MTTLEMEIKSTENAKNCSNCQVYPKRWFILALYFIYTISSAMQWIQYSVIADVVVKYYNVSYTAADWSSMIYMLVYVPFSFPGTYLLDKLGLRISILIGMLGTCIGAWIKVASVDPSRYWVLLVGQGVVAVSQIFALPVPPKLAAVWFGEKEVSSACSIGVLAAQVGAAIGFLIPPLIVKQGHVEVIASGLFTIAMAFAVFTTLLLPILYFFFSDAPPTPPSVAQMRVQDNAFDFAKSLRTLGKNPSYIVLTASYGINLGYYYAISILLNQIILYNYPNGYEDVGRIGLIMMFFGMMGAVGSGVILDKFGRFKLTTLSFNLLYLVSSIAYSLLINRGLIGVYVIGAFMGFFMNGILTIGFELGVEITYPEPEGAIGGFLTTSAQIFGIIFTYLYSFLFNNLNQFWANLVMCIVLALTDIVLAFIKYDLKRQAVKSEETISNKVI